MFQAKVVQVEMPTPNVGEILRTVMQAIDFGPFLHMTQLAAYSVGGPKSVLGNAHGNLAMRQQGIVSGHADTATYARFVMRDAIREKLFEWSQLRHIHVSNQKETSNSWNALQLRRYVLKERRGDGSFIEYYDTDAVAREQQLGIPYSSANWVSLVDIKDSGSADTNPDDSRAPERGLV